jgi:hypothetical protein
MWEGDPARTSGSHSSPVIWRAGDKTLAIANVAGGEMLRRSDDRP